MVSAAWAWAVDHQQVCQILEAQTLWGRARTFARQPSPDWTAALVDLDRAVELFEAMEARPSLARALHDRAQALRALGRADEATEVARRSDGLALELGLKDLPSPQS